MQTIWDTITRSRSSGVTACVNMALQCIGGARRGTRCSDVRRKYGTCNDHRTPDDPHTAHKSPRSLADGDSAANRCPARTSSKHSSIAVLPKVAKRVSAVQAHMAYRHALRCVLWRCTARARRGASGAVERGMVPGDGTGSAGHAGVG